MGLMDFDDIVAHLSGPSTPRCLYSLDLLVDSMCIRCERLATPAAYAIIGS